jgi:hypothetical protein
VPWEVGLPRFGGQGWVRQTRSLSVQ